MKKFSVATQIIVGGVTGWCAGFLFQKVGKLPETEVRWRLSSPSDCQSGYVQSYWKRVEKELNKAKRQTEKSANKAAPEINNIIEEVAEFVKHNIVISSGFVGGEAFHLKNMNVLSQWSLL
uniref:Uncharacterized protein n=1 Tax=Equus asinus TaxID=9793 RepID=A0A9L0K0S7_EQUAS